MTAEELLERYGKGERDFSGVDLSGINIARGYASELLFTDAKWKRTETLNVTFD